METYTEILTATAEYLLDEYPDVPSLGQINYFLNSSEIGQQSTRQILDNTKTTIQQMSTEIYNICIQLLH